MVHGELKQILIEMDNLMKQKKTIGREIKPRLAHGWDVLKEKMTVI